MKQYIKLEGDKTKQLLVEIIPLDNIIRLTAQFKYKVGFIDIITKDVIIDTDYESLTNHIYNMFIEMDEKLPVIIEKRDFLSTLKYIEINKDYESE